MNIYYIIEPGYYELGYNEQIFQSQMHIYYIIELGYNEQISPVPSCSL